MSRKHEVLDWISDRRAQHLFSAANPLNTDRESGYHTGWADALHTVRLHVMSMPEGERTATS